MCVGEQECLQVQHKGACECGQGRGGATEGPPGGLLRPEPPGQVHDWRPLALLPHHLWRYVPVAQLLSKMHLTWLLFPEKAACYKTVVFGYCIFHVDLSCPAVGPGILCSLMGYATVNKMCSFCSCYMLVRRIKM